MVIPSNYEDLNKSVLVIGADIIRFLKMGICEIEDLYRKVHLNKKIHINYFFDIITFLRISEIITIENNYYIKLK